VAEGVERICPNVFATTHHQYSTTANALGSACPRRGARVGSWVRTYARYSTYARYRITAISTKREVGGTSLGQVDHSF
jgi:hypothetical protein